jgi:hypothetical protein
LDRLDYVFAKERAIKAMAAYTARGKDAGTLLKEELNFPPPDAAPLFAGMSETQKFTAVVEAAKRFGGQESEKAVLAKLSMALARLYDTAKMDPDLISWHGFDPASNTFRVTPDEAKIVLRLPERLPEPTIRVAAHRNHIRVLAEYLESSPVGGYSEILRWKCGLTEKEATDLLLRVNSLDAALQHVLAKRSDHQQAAWISRTAREVASLSEGARRHPELQVYFSQSQPTVPAPAQGRPLVNPNPPHIPELLSGGAARDMGHPKKSATQHRKNMPRNRLGFCAMPSSLV